MSLAQSTNWGHWNLEVLICEQRGNRSTRGKTSLSKDENQQQSHPHMTPSVWESNPDHTGGKRVLSTFSLIAHLERQHHGRGTIAFVQRNYRKIMVLLSCEVLLANKTGIW